jgi:deoxyribonuclease-4
LTSLTHALSVGDGIGSDGVVLHPGHVMKGHEYGETIKLIAKTIKKALKDTDECPLLLENAAGAKAIGMKFEHLADLIDLLDGDPRVGVCVDSCHSLAAGYEVDTNESLAAVIDEFDKVVGLDRLKCIHLNDSQGELGSHKDRHANLGEGELGKKGCAAWLSEPRFEDLPVLMEIPGQDGKGPGEADVKLARKLRTQGVKSRS